MVCMNKKIETDVLPARFQRIFRSDKRKACVMMDGHPVHHFVGGTPNWKGQVRVYFFRMIIRMHRPHHNLTSNTAGGVCVSMLFYYCWILY